MVRYSKLPFRLLALDYGVDVAYTPMMLAKEFVRSEFARQADFSSRAGRGDGAGRGDDAPLVVQFGAGTAADFGRAAEMVRPYCDGVDLNCGCPQSWAVAAGVGCALMARPELVRDMVVEAKRRCGPAFAVSIKIRVHGDLDRTRRWVRVVQDGSGVDYFTVHGRRRSTRSSVPVDLDAIRAVVQVAEVPVFANGDVFTKADAQRIVEFTGCDGELASCLSVCDEGGGGGGGRGDADASGGLLVGVMAARGLLTNPALFAGFERTPWGAVERFVDYATTYPIPFRLTQHHVSEMLDGLVPKKERSAINETTNTIVELIDWLDERFVLRRPGEEGFGRTVEIERRPPAHDIV